MVSEKPEEQNPENPDDHDGALLFDLDYVYAGTPNRAICNYCHTEVMLGLQSVMGERNAADHRHGLSGQSGCTRENPNPDAGLLP